jgi:hypothetical protein
MPTHKQAGHTTVLTKMRNQHNKTLAMQVPPTLDVQQHLELSTAAKGGIEPKALFVLV